MTYKKYININQRQFATCTYTFSWCLHKTPFQLLQKIRKKKNNEIISKHILPRNNPKICQQTEEALIIKDKDDIMDYF
jgi:hypothetical protein